MHVGRGTRRSRRGPSAGRVPEGGSAVAAEDWVVAAEAYLDGVATEEEETERQWGLLEERAIQGLDGPRPCMEEWGGGDSKTRGRQ